MVSTFDSLIKALESNEENLQIRPMPTLIFHLQQRQKTALKKKGLLDLEDYAINTNAELQLKIKLP